MAVEALERMAPIAWRNGDSMQADFWKSWSKRIMGGVLNRSGGLLTSVEGKDILAELRMQDSLDDLLWGLSFVGWAQIPALQTVPDSPYIDHLAEVYERQANFLWGNYRVPFSAACPDRPDSGLYETVWQVISKQFAWETFYHAVRGNWNRLLILQNWLTEYNNTSLLGEAFNYKPFVSGEKYIQDGDGGIQEQCAWWVWAQAKLRGILAE